MHVARVAYLCLVDAISIADSGAEGRSSRNQNMNSLSSDISLHMLPEIGYRK